MIQKGTVRLETERMILRRITNDDVQQVYDNWASDPAVTEFLTWPPHADTGVTEEIVKSWVDSYDRPDFYHWGMELKSTHELIGNISTVGMNEQIGEVVIGYCMGTAWWHQGYMSEALQRIMDFFFDEVQVNRIQSDHDPHNPHSGMVMQKCGLKYEGTLKQHAHNNQGIVDDCIYGLTAAERNHASN
ncbi:MAG: GNAT family N-acetyltransferase [Solobacterium sp.]|nr:GNAT family N-acetyltransferase [Solobacterium sp.]MCH4265734.1 GNAT family N-acetyltransferase [Solobacterium sp.]